MSTEDRLGYGDKVKTDNLLGEAGVYVYFRGLVLLDVEHPSGDGPVFTAAEARQLAAVLLDVADMSECEEESLPDGALWAYRWA